MTMELPRDVSLIINTLENAGYEAYAVGGCVRDTILGREPQDWDITTSAKPEQIKKLFRKTVDTGIQHGTVTVMLNHEGYEVTTYRIDGEYEDNRHPKSVEFTNNLTLDLERRDFTINAMAYNDTRGLVDEFLGIQDIEDKVIRCVGNPGARFDEDALRMLRAVRFSGQLGFQIEENTRQAIVERARHLKKISAERIRVELTKLLVSKGAGQLRVAYQTGMTQFFLPEFDRMMVLEQMNPHHIYTVGEHTVRSIEIMNYFFRKWEDMDVSQRYSTDVDYFNGGQLQDYFGKFAEDTYELLKDISSKTRKLVSSFTQKQHTILCVTMLLHDIGKPDTMTVDKRGIGHFYGHPDVGVKIASQIMKRLTFDNETIDTVKRLIRWHDYQFGQSVKSMRRAVAKIGKDIMPLLFLVQYSDILAQNPNTFTEKIAHVNQAICLWEEVIASNAALELKDLEITGSDLIALGISPGPKIGNILKNVLEYVIENPNENKKEELLTYVKEKMQKVEEHSNGS